VQSDLGQTSLEALVENRDHSGPAESRLVRWRLSGAHQVTDVALLAAHPTLVPRDTAQLDADFPSALAAAAPSWESTEPDGGERLRSAMVIQGAVGDASIRREVASTPEAVAAAFQRLWPAVEPQRTPTSLEIASVEVDLPPPDFAVAPGWTRRAADNLGLPAPPRSRFFAWAPSRWWPFPVRPPSLPSRRCSSRFGVRGGPGTSSRWPVSAMGTWAMWTLPNT
jgi:hypothetical protein